MVSCVCTRKVDEIHFQGSRYVSRDHFPLYRLYGNHNRVRHRLSLPVRLSEPTGLGDEAVTPAKAFFPLFQGPVSKEHS